MSDLQDLIARNAVMAYNQGVERGATEERERIIKLLEVEAHNYDNDGIPFSGAPIRYCIQLLIKGEQK